MHAATSNPTVVFRGPRQVAVEDRPVPEPAAGELLIRTHCSLVSTGTELSLLEGDTVCGETWREMRDYPFLPGYDNVGTVVAVGDAVDPAWIGKRVASWGTHGAYVTMDTAHCWPVLRDVSDEEATFLMLSHVALNGLRRSRLVFGEAAVVFGLGIIGQLTVQLCRLAGARPVIGVDTSKRRVDQLAEIPGVVGILAGQEDTAEAIATMTGGRMADVVFELTGNAEIIPEELKLLREQGRFVLVSSPRSATHLDLHDLCNRPSLTIIGAHNWSHPEHATADNPWTMARHSQLFFDLVADGDLDVGSLISHRVGIEDAPDLYSRLMSDRGRAMGVLFQFSGSAPEDDREDD